MSVKTIRVADLMDSSALADLLGVPAQTIYNWSRREKLPDPLLYLNGGPVWERGQFPIALRRELSNSTQPRRAASPRRRG